MLFCLYGYCVGLTGESTEKTVVDFALMVSLRGAYKNKSKTPGGVSLYVTLQPALTPLESVNFPVVRRFDMSRDPLLVKEAS